MVSSVDQLSVKIPRPTNAYSYFPHDADVGVIGRGATLENSFEAAAEATFAVMADLPFVRPEIRIHFDFFEPDVELALATWLNRLLAEAKAAGIILSRFHVSHQAQGWHGEAFGERWHDGLERGVEVKGATLTMLSVSQTEHGWEARCVVDV